MRYGGDKIKLVTDDLRLGDTLQVLGFDTCGFALIGKWKNEYGTYGDPLIDTTTPCPNEQNCPNCQPKINNIKDLPGRPNSCDDGDALLMLTKTGNLKTVCESQFRDSDKKVAVSSGDESPGYLNKKLIQCDENGPIYLREVTSGGTQALCIGFNPEKTKQKLVNLEDGPKRYPNTAGVLVGTNEGWNWVEPGTGCDKARYQYVVYDTRSKTMIMTCDKINSLASWTLDSGAVIKIPPQEHNTIFLSNRSENSGNHVGGSYTYMSTEDIKLCKADTNYLFEITTPGVYTITANCTMWNKTEAGIQAIRGGMFIQEGMTGNSYDTGDAKFDSRKYTEYVTDDPNQPETGETNLDLTIMSFNTVYIMAFANASVDEPVKIGFKVTVDTNLNDVRMSESQRRALARDQIEMRFTDGTAAQGPKTVISCVRNGDIPTTFERRTLSDYNYSSL